MGSSLPPVPQGNRHHPILLLSIAAHDLAASVAFYRALFGWEIEASSTDLASVSLPSGPAVVLQADAAAGSQGVVPFIAVPDVAASLHQLVRGGGTEARAPWQAPHIGTLARFTDPAGTLYGLIEPLVAATPAHIPAPFGDAPRPPVHTICSLELHAGNLDAAAEFFGARFGWGTLATMPQYLMFDPGASIGGVFQAHTPATRGLAYIQVADVASTLDAIDGAGGKRLGAAMPVPGMATFGYFTDPSGTAMGLMGG
jgi:predicted enzyme related to lactoylglutathione lyase